MHRPEAARVHFGASPLADNASPHAGRSATGGLVTLDGEDCYVIEDVQALPPFLTSVVSDADHWLYVVSNGGLTAGRKSPATALFPYVTEDKLADAAGTTGPTTTLIVTRGDARHLWHPFAASGHLGDPLVYRTRRRLMKNVLGTWLAFEEDNLDLGLTFRATWQTSERHGIVRACRLTNTQPTPVRVEVLDGLLNLMPGAADEQIQLALSCLLDAYKQHERVPGTTLALFTLAAQVVDRPEPREALHATTVWSHGLGDTVYLGDVREAFARGVTPRAEARVRGQRGAYLAQAELALDAAEHRTHDWWFVGDVQRTQADVAALVALLADPDALIAEVLADVARGSERLQALLAATDAQQLSADRIATAHHLANVLFNDLRGGVYAEDMDIPGRDFAAFVRGANRRVAERHAATLDALPEREPRAASAARIAAIGDPDLTRLQLEYLPLCFSRRHGDPSRPWNRFNIAVKDEAGRRVLDYQGNWRDIFQNWEALSRSFPGFVEQILAKFVNASTVDGFNPYRIGRAGIDWEVPEPDHPWSTIGYWGDHQIIYLLRLLELSHSHHPERLAAWLEKPAFTYAAVPYELRPHADIVANPRDTIRFDTARHARVSARAAALGSDGRLLHGDADRGPELARVTLLEKLLVPALAKLASFVPEGGIWMNTQRPEWNDANNALAGYGLSMVTLYHLERYLAFVAERVAALASTSTSRDGTTPLSAEVAAWLTLTVSALEAHADRLGAGRAESVEAWNDPSRGALMTALGEAASAYRAAVYAHGLGAPVPVPLGGIVRLLDLARRFLAQTSARARRADGLFHAYNVLVPRPDGHGFGVEHLAEMLEGQVAALTSPSVSDEVACEVLDALGASRLYRRDQQSFILYPDRQLPGFLDKNIIPPEALAAAPALALLLAADERAIIVRDAAGRLRFGAGMHNAAALDQALARLASGGFPGLDARAIAAIHEVYEAVFHHRAFTGRSGSMFAYEGLGSIYWHMVGKLLLAVQERHRELDREDAPAGDDRQRAALLGRFAAHYQAISAGMGGTHKSPAAWGAFPLDPYSHSPAHGGARQPGMTGQVKEEVLIRLGELGVLVRDGAVAFHPRLLRKREFLTAPAVFEPLVRGGARLRLELPVGALAFTLCQVPVVYYASDAARLVVTESDGSRTEWPGATLDRERSAALFERTGRLARLEVWVPTAGLPD